MFTVCSVFYELSPPLLCLPLFPVVLPHLLLFFVLLFNDVMEGADESLRNEMIYCCWHTHSLMLSFSLFLRSYTLSFYSCQSLQRCFFAALVCFQTPSRQHLISLCFSYSSTSVLSYLFYLKNQLFSPSAPSKAKVFSEAVVATKFYNNNISTQTQKHTQCITLNKKMSSEIR